MNIFSVFGKATERLVEEKYTYRASALAFTTLLAVVPLLSVILSIIAIFPFFDRFVELTQDYILTNFIPTSSNVIQFYLEEFIKKSSHLPTVGLFFLLITSIMLILTVEHTLNEIWHVQMRRKKWFSFLIYWAVLLSAPILIGVSIFISSYLFSLSWFAGTTNTLGIKQPLLNLIPLLINTVIFSLIYIVVPNEHVKLRNGLFGGLVAAILFEAAKKGFALYIFYFPSYELIYGALATIPIFLVWIYISWLIVLYGALVVYQISRP